MSYIPVAVVRGVPKIRCSIEVTSIDNTRTRSRVIVERSPKWKLEFDSGEVYHCPDADTAAAIIGIATDQFRAAVRKAPSAKALSVLKALGVHAERL